MTAIEWADESWNPIVGCSVVSPGCTNCYAMRQAGTRLAHLDAYQGLTAPSKAGPVWTGAVRRVESALVKPLHWRKPRRVFVNSMGDLFHEAVPDAWIDRVFAVMALCPAHQFIVLTKRPERMRAYFDDPRTRERAVYKQILKISLPRNLGRPTIGWWPLPNVILGVSAEDQARADQRVPVLLDTPAALRCVSYEPALGPVDYSRINGGIGTVLEIDALKGREIHRDDDDRWTGCERLDWIICGGESGPGARALDSTWVRSVVEQCRAAGVACFVKQLGACPYESHVEYVEGKAVAVNSHDIPLRHSKGGDPAEWPADLRIQEYPNGALRDAA